MAAANYAYDLKIEGTERYVSPPPELVKAFECLRWNTLPRAGGLQDQPMLLLHRMGIALNAYENVQAFRTAQRNLTKAEDFGRWSSANARIMKFMEFVWKLQGVFDA